MRRERDAISPTNDTIFYKKRGIPVTARFCVSILLNFKGDEIFHFIPSEGKEIVINIKSLQVENLGEVFVFQRGNRFIRLPLYQLLLISDLHTHLNMIIEGSVDMEIEVELPEVVSAEAKGLIESLESGKPSTNDRLRT